MSRFLVPVATVAGLSAGIIAAEMHEPGITILTSLAIAKVLTLCIKAAIWPLGATAFGWLMWQGGKLVGERDTLQAVAEATGRKNRKADAHPEAEWN